MRASSFLACWLAATASVVGCSSAPHATTCTSSAACPTGQFCVDSRCTPSGGDSGICRMGCECTTDATCAMGAPTCIDAVCASGSCFFRTHDERCMSGQTCDVVIGCVGGGVDANAGDAPMTSDAGSDTGSLDAYAIDLGQPDTGARSPLGGRCTTGGDCAPIGGMIAMCMTMDTTTGITFNGGYCTTTCSVLGGTRSCPSGGVCVDPSGTLTDGFCAVACSGGVQCRISEGYGCRRPRMGTGGTTLACLPPGL